jgi:hypothetical protein
MFKRWSKEDRGSWERSEVMKELESQILAKYAVVERFAQEKTNLLNPGDVANTKKAVEDLTGAFEGLSKAVSGSAADDGAVEKSCACDNSSDQMCAVCGDNYTDDEVSMAKDEIINELQRMADEAIGMRNIKLAYKIERTIAEMKEE